MSKKRTIPVSTLTRRTLMQYFVSLFACPAAFAIVVYLLRVFCSLFIWYESDPLYRVLKWAESYTLLWGSIVFVVCWIAISYHFLAKPLRYLDEIVSAAGQLVHPSETPIALPPDLKNAEYELNLAREQALRSALLAKEEEQRKNDLIVYLAHDLKTPMTSIIGYLTLLRDEPQLSEQLRARYTGIALDKAERLEALVEEFFEITRFNLTTLTLETERRNLSRMLEQITSEFEPILAERDLRLCTDIAPQVEVLCDPDKLERVFDNLIRNAISYSYAHSVITLSMLSEGTRVTISVKNHGKTIPPDKLERIFDQFFRVDPSRGSDTGGAGLGLAIAQQIVHAHGGEITAQSGDESITFTVTLPQCKKFV